MKKLILICLVLSACKKDRACQCKVTSSITTYQPGQISPVTGQQLPGSYSTTSSTYTDKVKFSKATKKAVKQNCLNRTDEAGSSKVVYSDCKLL